MNEVLQCCCSGAASVSEIEFPIVEQSNMIIVSYLSKVYSGSLLEQIKNLPAEIRVKLTLFGVVGHQMQVQTLFPNYLYCFKNNPLF